MGCAKIITNFMNQQARADQIYFGTASYSTMAPMPTAYVTINRNRLKLYNFSNVYLKDGSNFEIELWNPKTTRVLAKITINGVSMSSGGIVVNPGQRVYLERFLDAKKKFVFSTYDVENSAEAIAAIQNNGLIQVDFYDEQPYYPGPYYLNNTITIQNTPSQWTTTNIPNSFMGSSGTGVIGMSSNNVTTNYCCNVSDSVKNACMDSIETGRIDRGGKSNQDLVDTYGTFNPWTCAAYSIKILPERAKPVEVGEIRAYCSGCGRRWRLGENFCQRCGTKNA
jgi:hypothetical protein